MKIKHLLYIIMSSCLLFACQGHEIQRNEGDSQALISIEDSMNKQSPIAREMIEKGLRNASDSLTYFEYLARLGMYFCLSETPDSMPLYINKVVAYARPLSETP